MVISFPKRTRYADLYAEFITARETYDDLIKQRHHLEKDGATLREKREADRVIELYRQMMTDAHRAVIALRLELEKQSA